MRRRVGVLVAILGLAALGSAMSARGSALPAAAASAAPTSTLLRDVQASIDTLTGETGACPAANPPDGCFQNDAEAEPSIAVDPANPNHAIAVFHVGRANDGGAADDGFATTFDQGRTWTSGLFPGLTKASGGTVQRVSDPRVVIGPGGVAVATAQPYNNDVAPALSSVVSMTSLDGGLSWAQPVVLESDLVSQNIPQSDAYLLNFGFDQPDLTIDMSSAPGHHLGRVYLAWVRLALVNAAFAAYSDDNGATWQKGPLGTGFVIYPGFVPLYPRPLVLANGDLAVMGWNAGAVAPAPNYVGDPGPLVNTNACQTALTNQTGGYQLYIAAAAGGVSGMTPLVFGLPSNAACVANNTLRGQRSAEKEPLFAVDPHTGRMYVAWTDARFRNDGANDILLTFTDDRGATWAYPKRIHPSAAGDNVNHWCAMIDAGADGVLRLAYRQRQEAANPNADFTNFSRQVDTFYVESHDGGVTFTAPLQVNTNASDMRFGAFDGGQTNVGQGGVFLGDYDALAFAGGITYIVRSEPVSLAGDLAPTFPPVVHHQRTWVAVLGPVSSTSSPTSAVSNLPNTPAAPVTPGLLLVAGVAIALTTACLTVARRLAVKHS
ncbi:MAG TPA: sialidase family protein [Candidatus Dormibacteraeota bacterium]|nr:sialidase family protein [Candidatus Dormibacteraeota bacterium]